MEKKIIKKPKKRIMSLKAMNAHIEATNEKFENASDAEKRVMVAEDVISRLRLGQFEAEAGAQIFSADGEVEFGHDSVKEFFTKRKTTTCNACQKGAILMSYVCRVNEFNFIDLEMGAILSSTQEKKLKEIFPMDQMNLMETAFEGAAYSITEQKKDQRAKNFFERYPAHNKRMIAICENIIENEGEFKP